MLLVAVGRPKNCYVESSHHKIVSFDISMKRHATYIFKYDIMTFPYWLSTDRCRSANSASHTHTHICARKLSQICKNRCFKISCHLSFLFSFWKLNNSYILNTLIFEAFHDVKENIGFWGWSLYPPEIGIRNSVTGPRSFKYGHVWQVVSYALLHKF